MQLEISIEDANKIATYLFKQPFGEVHGLVALLQALKPVPEMPKKELKDE